MYLQKRHSIWDIQYRFICIPIVEINIEEREYLAQVISNITQKHNCIISEAIIISDHIQILFSISIDQPLKKIINVIRGYSSFLMRKKFSRLREYPNFWIKGYYISTIGEITEQKAMRIIRQLSKKKK